MSSTKISHPNKVPSGGNGCIEAWGFSLLMLLIYLAILFLSFYERSNDVAYKMLLASSNPDCYNSESAAFAECHSLDPVGMSWGLFAEVFIEYNIFFACILALGILCGRVIGVISSILQENSDQYEAHDDVELAVLPDPGDYALLFDDSDEQV